jgi:hypothetical protein
MAARSKKAELKFLFDGTGYERTVEGWTIIENCCGNVLQFFENNG